MPIKKYNPTSPARRFMTVSTFEEITSKSSEKTLLSPVKKNAGRNSYGRITVRHRGGGNRKKYRIIDFKRQKFDVEGTVKTLEYDPNRSAFIALVEYTDGEKAYIIAPEGLKVGDKVTAGANADIKPGTGRYVIHYYRDVNTVRVHDIMPAEPFLGCFIIIRGNKQKGIRA